MSTQSLYTNLWRKYLPVINILLKKTETGDQQLKMYRHEFEDMGKKPAAGFSFNFDMVNRKVISGKITSAVARDFIQVLLESDKVAEYLKGHHIGFSLSSSFILTIKAKEAEQKIQMSKAAVAQPA